MKRIILIITAILTITVSAGAMSYEQARREALFLTDKMAYELNLTDEQYDAAYEINLDYLMGVTSRDDVYGTYWTRRNLDFSYILLDWQWSAFQAATYFYRPLYWNAGYWHFGIYARYPRRDYFYFSRPTVYITYCGGHSWHHNGGRSYYYEHRHNFVHHTGRTGMRDRWDRGDFQHRTGGRKNSSTNVTVNNGNMNNGGNKGNSKFGGSHTSGAFGNNREPSAATTNRPQTTGTGNHGSTFGGSRNTINRNVMTSKPATNIKPQSMTKVTTPGTQPKQSTMTRPNTIVNRNSERTLNRNVSTTTNRSIRPAVSQQRSTGTFRKTSPANSSVKSNNGRSNRKGAFGERR